MPTPTDPTAAALFRVANTAALAAWLLLAATLVVPRLRTWGWRVTGLGLPTLLAVTYAATLAAAFRSGATGGFDTIAHVRTLFADDRALAAGWMHYLAFDLVVGTAIARAGLAAAVPRWLLLPCLALTFVVGPAGLLAFLVIRLVVGRVAGPRRSAVPAWEVAV